MRIRTAGVLALSLAGCATAGVRPRPEMPAATPAAQAAPITDAVPGRTPAALPSPSPGPGVPSDGAAADFRAAVTKFSSGDRTAARTALESWLAHNPGHPFRPTAAALVGRIALASGDAVGARSVLERHAPGSNDPGVAFVTGIVEGRLGNDRRALTLLQPFVASGAPSLGGAGDDEAALLLRAALAESFARAGNATAAREQWDAYQRQPGLRPHEIAYARTRAAEIGGRASPVATTDSTAARPGAAPAAAAPLPASQPARATDDSPRLGLAVPLSGKYRALGDVAVRAAMMAVTWPAPGGGPSQFQIHVRDTGNAARPASATAAELVGGEAVLGIVGLADGGAVTETTRAGVPFLILDEQAPGERTTAFQLTHPAEARAAALARRAIALGARTFAILGPDSAPGRRLADAFARAAGANGGTVVAQALYPATANSFSGAIAQLRAVVFDAVFVPDDAERLELVAPALAAHDLWPRPWVARGRATAAAPTAKKPREILLLSTARGLSQRLLKNAGRYVQGALLSPGYFAASDDRSNASFRQRFRALYHQEPTATDAYCFDGIRVLRTAIERGAATRAAVLDGLARDSFDGVTGNVRFGPDHGRSDAPPLYVVHDDEIRADR